MSHLPERKEKTCLNCKATLYGRYCHVCGQENLEPKETVWHLVEHFFNDITHFDGKFFSTVKYLLRKPGFLSREYMAGRRASYLNPIRMYVFTSAIFFLVFFSLKGGNWVNVNVKKPPDKLAVEGIADLEKDKDGLQVKLKKAEDVDDKRDIQEQIRWLDMEVTAIKKQYGDTTTRKFDKKERGALTMRAFGDSLKHAGLSAAARDTVWVVMQDEGDLYGGNLFGLHQGRYESVAAYDSSERSLPDSLRDGWLTRALTKKLILTDVEYRRDRRSYKEHFIENLMHSFPKILFFSLPFLP